MPESVPLEVPPITDQFYEDFFKISRELWAQTHPSGMLRAFFGMLAESFGVRRAGSFRVTYRGGKFTFQRENSGLERNPAITGLPPGIVEKFKEQMSLTFHSSAVETENSGLSEPEGVYLTECDGHTLMWAQLGNPRKGGMVCFWDTEGQTVSMNQLHLAIRLLQHENSWFCKLDKTQALLYLDDLTGLFNYRYLDIALESELRRAYRYHQSFCLLFIDLDDFKGVNDRFGHLAGSKVLKQTGTVLQEELREVDTIIRYGGDEYVIILLGADSELGVLVAERIRRRIAENTFEAEDHRIPLSCSIGVACFPEHGKSKDALLKMADETMYSSKRKGKNRVMLVGEQAIPPRKSDILSP